MAKYVITVTKPGLDRAQVTMTVVPRIGESLHLITDFGSMGGRVVDVQYSHDERSRLPQTPTDIEVILG